MYYVLTKKKIITSILFIFLTLLSSITCLVFASESGNWGLCFRKPNTPPEGNATQEELSKYNAYYIGDTNEKCVYLTFDVGYEAGFMENILDVLNKHNIKAAFFVVGNYLKTDASLVQRMVDEGHIVGNHTYSHPNMSKMQTYDDFLAQMQPNEKMFKEITGKDIDKFYRPPQGVYSLKNLQDAKDYGYTTVFWSVAHVDWQTESQPDHASSINLLMSRVHNGAIILLHAISKTNSEILDEFLTRLEDEGYTFKTLYELPQIQAE